MSNEYNYDQSRYNFQKGDIVGDVSDEYTEGRTFKVKSNPAQHDGDWYMLVYDREFYSTKLRLCKDFVFIERPAISENIIKKGLKSVKLTKQAKITAIVLGVVLILGLWVMGNYNSLATGQNEVDNSWAKVETQYQRRNDLINNIVGSVQGAQKNEQKFVDIANARSGIKPIDPSASTEEKAATASQNEATVVSIVPKLQEAYPELRSNDQVSKLITELQTTETTIATERNKYNDTVTNFNNGVVRFPKSMFAGLFGFEKQKLYKADQGSSKAPQVKL